MVVVVFGGLLIESTVVIVGSVRCFFWLEVPTHLVVVAFDRLLVELDD